MKYFIYIILILLLLSGCQSKQSDRFKFNDQVYQNDLIAKLKQENIEFSQNEDGSITYDIKIKEKIHELAKIVTEHRRNSETAVSYEDGKHFSMLVDALKNKKIDYRIVEDPHDNKKWIIWNKDQENVVQELMSKIDGKIIEEKTKMKK